MRNIDIRAGSNQSHNMSTTRPPLNRNQMFALGFVIAALLAVLVGAGILFSGMMVSPMEHQAVLQASKEAQQEMSSLAEENQDLKSQLETKTQTIQSLEARMAEARADAKQAQSLAETAQARVDVFVEKEQEVEFVINRRQMEIEDLAKQIHALEGVQVEIVDNGLVVSGIASPFSLGSSRIEDDTLIPKLTQISEIFKAANAEHSNKYYAAAVGNTDATPVQAWSGHHSNLWLGAKRARTLADFMKSAGFPKEQTFLISWGEIKAGDKTFDPESRKAQVYIVAQEAFQAALTEAAGGSSNPESQP